MPMAIVANAADWTIRFTKLLAVRKLLFCDWKTIAMMIRPTMIGSEPSWPERTSVHHRSDRAGEPAAVVVDRSLGGRHATTSSSPVSTRPGTLVSAPEVMALTTCSCVTSVRLNSATF